jgi:DNA mismatch repair protein MutS
VHSESAYLKRLADALNPCFYIAEKIIKQIIDNPPALVPKAAL